MEEFYKASRAGLSYMDWTQMTRWQVLDFVLRRRIEVKGRMDAVKNKSWREIAGVVLARLMGL